MSQTRADPIYPPMMSMGYIWLIINNDVKNAFELFFWLEFVLKYKSSKATIELSPLFLQEGVSVQGQCKATDDSVLEAGDSYDLDGKTEPAHTHELVALVRGDAQSQELHEDHHSHHRVEGLSV